MYSILYRDTIIICMKVLCTILRYVLAS